jgi:hypothetical protein
LAESRSGDLFANDPEVKHELVLGDDDDRTPESQSGAGIIVGREGMTVPLGQRSPRCVTGVSASCVLAAVT